MTDRVRVRQRLERQGIQFDVGTDHQSLPRSVSAQRRPSVRTISSSIHAPSPASARGPRKPYRTHRKHPSTFSMPADGPSTWDNVRQGSRMRTESIRSGYAFSHEHGFGERITSGVLRMHSESRGSLRLKQKYDTISTTREITSKKARTPLTNVVQKERL